jgi:small ligand-binding sensory domain FIST
VSNPGFLTAHATHPDAMMALALAAAQLDAQRASRAPVDRGRYAPLGFIYITDHYAGQADALLAELRLRWPGVPWVGAVGVGVAVSGVEYFDEPALVLMLGELPPGSFELFSGERPLLRDDLQTALVHADGGTPDIGELIGELSARTTSGYLFGGLAASRGRAVQFCAPVPPAGLPAAAGLYEGGISGVAFTSEVRLLSRITQGCQPVGPVRRVDAAQDNIVLRLDGRSALQCLLDDLGIDLGQPREAVPRLRSTLAGLTDAGDDALLRDQFGADTRVRHLIGLDPMRGAVAIADQVEPGMTLAFCRRDVEAARRDLVRICAEIREELCPADGGPSGRILGAVYVSCSGRGGPHFGGDSAELQIVRHALGDVPLAGFFAGGEIARRHLFGYTGVLTVFVEY